MHDTDTAEQAHMDPAATPSTHTLPASLGVAALASAALSACGGGDNPEPTTTAAAPATLSAQSVATGTPTAVPAATPAWRFLVQATMGPTPDDLAAFKGTSALTYSAWLDRQMSLTTTPQTSLLARVRLNGSNATGYNPYPSAGQTTNFVHRDHVFDAWWHAALTGKDQLRQRIAFALSEIFVISMVQQAGHPYGSAHYYDTLAANAFKPLYDLVLAVSKHPAMGNMLSHINNQPRAWGKRPDENFARELLQLFTIGLQELRMDGSVITDTSGKPYETYLPQDIEIIASIMTGWGWDRTNSLFPERQFGHGFVETYDEGPQVTAMVPYAPAHEVFTAAPFLSVATGRIVSQGTDRVTVRLFAHRNTTNGVFDNTVLLINNDVQGNLERLIAMVLRHPNVAPFLAKQMIQRLVTSNPSAAYISAAATTFKNSGHSLNSLVRAVLLDGEAISLPSSLTAAYNYYGKLREPVLRMTHLLRAFKAQSFSGRYLFCDTSNPSGWLASMRLGQGPLMAPSVFNFYRPGYRHPGTTSTSTTRVAPEMQIVNENSVAGYIHCLVRALEYGFGRWMGFDVISPRLANPAIALPGITAPDPQALTNNEEAWGREDIELDLRDEYNKALADIAGTTATTFPTTMVDAINLKVFGGTMPTALRTHIVNSIKTVTPTAANKNAVAAARVRLAILLAMVSPDYIVQK